MFGLFILLWLIPAAEAKPAGKPTKLPDQVVKTVVKPSSTASAPAAKKTKTRKGKKAPPPVVPPAIEESESLAAGPAFQTEYDFVKEQCELWEGEQDYLLRDQTRVDCVTEEMTVEFEFADNWKRALGPALHAASRTGKAAAIALILRRESDEAYVKELLAVKKSFGLELKIFQLKEQASE
jgi:hypothetical protein